MNRSKVQQLRWEPVGIGDARGNSSGETAITAEGISLKPRFEAQDLMGLEHLGFGIVGRAAISMRAGRSWVIYVGRVAPVDRQPIRCCMG